MVNLVIVGASLVCAVCAATSAILYEFGSTHLKIAQKLDAHAISWSPTSLLDQSGSPGTSPLFGIMWTTLWLFCGVIFPVYALLLGVVDSFQFPEEDDVLNSASFLGAGLFFSGMWSWLFTLQTPTSPWSAAAVSTLGAALMITSVAIYRPFARGVWHVSLFMGVPYEFATGWACTMAALTISTAVHVSDHGGAAAPNNTDDPTRRQSLVPLAVAASLACLAFSLSAPVLPIPFAFCMLHVSGRAWNVLSVVVSLIGCALGAVAVALDLY